MSVRCQYDLAHDGSLPVPDATLMVREFMGGVGYDEVNFSSLDFAVCAPCAAFLIGSPWQRVIAVGPIPAPVTFADGTSVSWDVTNITDDLDNETWPEFRIVITDAAGSGGTGSMRDHAEASEAWRRICAEREEISQANRAQEEILSPERADAEARAMGEISDPVPVGSNSEKPRPLTGSTESAIVRAERRVREGGRGPQFLVAVVNRVARSRRRMAERAYREAREEIIELVQASSIDLHDAVDCLEMATRQVRGVSLAKRA